MISRHPYSEVYLITDTLPDKWLREPERKQSAHLMSVLRQREQRNKHGRSIFGRLLFWRRSVRATGHEAGHATTSDLHAPRTAPVAKPDIRRNTPDIRSETCPDTRTGEHLS